MSSIQVYQPKKEIPRCRSSPHFMWGRVPSCLDRCHLDVVVYFVFPRGNYVEVSIPCSSKSTCEKHGKIECAQWNVSLSGWDRHTPPLIYPGLLPCSSTSLSLNFFRLYTCAMTLPVVLAVALLSLQAGALPGRDDPAILRRACPDYTSYASTPQ